MVMPFSEVVGHSRPLGLLSRSIARRSLPPSLLFTGPDGVGKRLVARAVAQALNCLDPVGVDGALAQSALFAPGELAPPPSTGLPIDACGVCSACRRIAKGTHPDIVSVDAPESGSVKIEAIRAVIGATAYRPFEGRTRVIVVDEADGLLSDSQDALLKSLEEPAAATVFVLLTSRPEMLLPTVRSRCSRIRFGRLSAGEVVRVLVERERWDADEAHAAAAVADGSVGRALDAQSKGFRNARDSALEALRGAAEASSPTGRLRAAQALIPSKPSSAGEREDVATRARVLASLLRDVAVIREGGRSDDLANADLADELRRLADRFDVPRLLEAFASADRSAGFLGRNASPKIVADWLAIRI